MRVRRHAPSSERANRGIWLAIILIMATLIGIAASGLAIAGGASPIHAIMTGFGTVGGAAVLLISLARFLDDGEG